MTIFVIICNSNMKFNVVNSKIHNNRSNMGCLMVECCGNPLMGSKILSDLLYGDFKNCLGNNCWLAYYFESVLLFPTEYLFSLKVLWTLWMLLKLFKSSKMFCIDTVTKHIFYYDLNSVSRPIKS